MTPLPSAAAPDSKSSDLLRLLVEGIDQVIFSLDLLGNFTYVSPPAGPLTGFFPEELAGKNACTVIASQDQDRFRAFLSLALHETPAPAAFTLVRKDGSTVLVHAHATPLVHAGTVAGAAGYLLEVPFGEGAEKIPYGPEGTIEEIVKYSRDGILLTDKSGVLTEWNPAMEQLTGIPRAAALGSTLWDVLSTCALPERRDDAFKEKIRSRFCSVIGSEQSVFRHSSSVIGIERPDKTRCTAEAFHFIVPSKDGNMAAAIVRDISNRVKSAEALRRANRQLGLMTGIARHDITNKVTALLGYICVAEMNYPNDPGLHEYFQKMERVARSIQSQIAFTKIYEDLGSQEPVWQELGQVLPHPDGIPEHVEFIPAVEGIRVLADAMLERVFYNLLDNTIRHGGDVSKISITTRKVPGGLVITWEDDGVGIPEYEKDRIFERGFGKNTGLGLFLVREILNLTGITIVETGEHGKGARFEITVPEGTYRCTTGTAPAG